MAAAPGLRPAAGRARGTCFPRLHFDWPAPALAAMERDRPKQFPFRAVSHERFPGHPGVHPGHRARTAGGLEQ